MYHVGHVGRPLDISRNQILFEFSDPERVYIHYCLLLNNRQLLIRMRSDSCDTWRYFKLSSFTNTKSFPHRWWKIVLELIPKIFDMEWG
jgi:hypothetical protein